MFGSRCRQLAGDGGVSIIAELARCAGGITALETLSGAGGRYEASRELYVQMVGSGNLSGHTWSVRELREAASSNGSLFVNVYHHERH